MASEDKNKTNIQDDLQVTTEQIKEVSPWAERIGVYIIGLMTTLGLVLIMYTGVRAATFNPLEDVPELLTHEDIVSNTDGNDTDASDDGDSDDEEDTDANASDNDEDSDSEEDTDANSSDNDEDSDNEEDTDASDDEEDAANEDSDFNGVVNSDAVNVRERPQADAQTAILGVLNTGDKIKVLDSDYNNIWMKVEYNGEVAFVSKALIDLID